jgi:hypothetical protein
VLRRPGGVAVLFAGLTVLLTWPQAPGLTSRIVAHHDSLFNLWRIQWVAHSLATDPTALFDANIFHPARRTLASSDPLLLEGALAAPLLWAGVPPITTYNLLLLGSFVLAALTMAALARHLTGRWDAAIVSGTAFAFAPYRFDHYFHLELLWGMWIPAAFLALHRARERRRAGTAVGLFVVLQILSCLYYGLFLVTMLVVAAPFILVDSDRRALWRALTGLAAGAALALVIGLAYSAPFRATREQRGDRPVGAIQEYSARPRSFLAASSLNRAYGWTSDVFGGRELHLFPGLTVAALALVALCRRWSREKAMYAALLVFSIFGALGWNSPLYRLLHEWIPPYRSLRVPARFGVFTSFALATLAGYGYARIAVGIPDARRASALFAMALVVLALEFASRPELAAAPEIPLVHRWLPMLPRAPVVELPLPRPHALPGHDMDYQYASTLHWYPVLNGYSGFYPADYLRLLEHAQRRSAYDWLKEVRSRGARYVIVHDNLFEDDHRAAVHLRRSVNRASAALARLQESEGGRGSTIWARLPAR